MLRLPVNFIQPNVPGNQLFKKVPPGILLILLHILFKFFIIIPLGVLLLETPPDFLQHVHKILPADGL